MTTYYREICPVEGCRLWRGGLRPVGEDWGTSSDPTEVAAHLAADHPDVDPAQCWSRYEMSTPEPLTTLQRAALALLVLLALVGFFALATAVIRAAEAAG